MAGKKHAISESIYLECVQLNIGVAVRETLDHALDSFLGSCRVAGCLVAHLHDGAPILGGEILVRRLGCDKG